MSRKSGIVDLQGSLDVDDDAARFDDGVRISRPGRVSPFRAQEQEARGLGLADIDVVTGRFFRRRRENRFWQARRFDEPRGQPDAAHLARRHIVLPSRSGEVSARHALDGQWLGPTDELSYLREYEHVTLARLLLARLLLVRLLLARLLFAGLLLARLDSSHGGRVEARHGH